MMDFFTKFLKVFNSSAKPWQISLAMTLGFVLGLTPSMGILTWVVLFVAFVVNIPLGMMFFVAGHTAIIGYFLDGFMESLGYTILTAPALNEFFTTLYNSGLARLTYFDNTIVLGSWVIALLLSVPLFVVGKIFLTRYQETIKRVFSQYKILSWMKLFEEDETKKKKKPKAFRIWGVALFVILAGLVVAFVFFFAELLIKLSIEKGGALAMQKEVYVEDVNLSFSKGTLTIKGLEIANRGAHKSVVYIDTMHAGIDVNALLLKRVHIDDMHVKGMGFSQVLTQAFKEARTVQAKEAQEEAKKAQAKKEEVKTSQAKAQEKPKEPVIPNVDEVLASEDLQSKKRYETAKATIDTTTQKWQHIINNELGTNITKKYETKLANIKSSTNIKHPDDIKKLQNQVDTFTKSIDEDKKRIQTLQNELQADKKLLQQEIQAVKSAKDADFKALKDKYTFDKEGAFNIVGSVFGEDIKGYIATADEYYTMAQPYLQSDDKDEVTPKVRHEGRFIRFKEDTPSASWWIEKSSIDGTFKTHTFHASIHNAISSQDSIAKPTTLTIKSNTPTMQGLKINATLNRLNGKVEDTFEYEVARIPNTTLDMALVKAGNTNLSITGNLALKNGKDLTNTTQMLYSDAKLKLQGLSGRFANNVQKDLNKRNSFTIDVDATGTLNAPKIEVKTSLEKIFSDAFHAAMDAEIKAFEQALNDKLNALIQEQLGDLAKGDDKLVDVQKLLKGDASALDGLKNQANNYTNEAQKKLEADIKAKQKELEAKAQAKQKALEAKAKEEEQKAKQKAKQELKKAIPSGIGNKLGF